MPVAERHVGCELTFSLERETALALQIAPATTAGTVVTERLDLTLDGQPLAEEPVEVGVEHGGRVHVVRAGAGSLAISYAVTVAPPADEPERPSEPLDGEALTYLRQSRYCPSDALEGFAGAELGHLAAGPGLAAGIADWVFERLHYEAGTSGPQTTALDTLAANQGVCRDFAHLTIALCRARGIPARLAAVYAPGLGPMDFHAVVEVRLAGGWEVVDPTRLAPRSSLVRIATGRDAADTAFATTLEGSAELRFAEIRATVDGDLPVDDHRQRVHLP